MDKKTYRVDEVAAELAVSRRTVEREYTWDAVVALVLKFAESLTPSSERSRQG